MTGSKKRSESSVHVIVQMRKSEEKRLKIPRTEDIEKLTKGVYRIYGKPEKHKKHFLEIPHIAFKRSKEIPSRKGKNVEDILKRTYALVIYNFTKPTAQQKKRAQRLVKRSPCVRLRPGVLLFPHLRSKHIAKVYKKDKYQLLTAKEFSKRMEEFGASVIRFGKLRVSGRRSLNMVEQALDEMIRKEIGILVEKFKILKRESKISAKSVKKLKEKFRNLSTRYRLRKSTCDIIHRVWHYSYEKELKKVYNVMLQARRVITESSIPQEIEDHEKESIASNHHSS